MTLVDTSIWVERDRSTESVAAAKVRAMLTAGERVCVTEPVTMELMAGARDPIWTRRMMQGAELLRFAPETDFIAAATIFRLCRDRGHTPRSLVDCMIAAVAIREEVPLLARDADFTHIAAATPLELAGD